MKRNARTFFHSDHHIMHRNILTFQPEMRPFSTLEEMTDAIVEGWNSVVGVDDRVFFLGDFCFGGKQNVEIAGRLSGRKYLIMGNHDHYPIELYLQHFKRVDGCREHGQMILSHIPVHSSQLDSRFTLNVHGHLHSRKVKDDSRYLNSCLDYVGYKPLTIEELINVNNDG